ncbi:MAG: bifunctional diaminohydroxyphosphoribosylaminopyrimidine deaminase/5-amino-6-(5-phosphoribosylamino)uracil reductase RibD [Bacteroidales bacterium]|nr:bifunctional diaminohydroxyphosphoribosylaminopyrimidine deaminase/5-amino-6-(5-phosphoribosylamino)uracil reductase RibD [Bacteroidales bacterium]
MKPDEIYMNRCLELAKPALGTVAPNPMVGSVIVYRDMVISEGFHQYFGGKHAEASAIEKIKDKSILKDTTLYVNLEPCAHKGKTPPCAELITQHKIPRVVVGTADPNPVVSGKGINYLRNAGTEVLTGVLEDTSIRLNKRFFTYHVLKRPYIILKWAQTSDGFIDVIRKPGDEAGINWISNETSRMLVHKWRSEEQAIMIGTNTAKIDNPRLNTRYWWGKSPLRVVIDKRLSLSGQLHIFDRQVQTIIINELKNDVSGTNLEYVKINSDINFLPQLMNVFYERGIQSVIVEGGKQLVESLIISDLWDEARVFVGHKQFKTGLKAPDPGVSSAEQIPIQQDMLLVYRNHKQFHDQIKSTVKQINYT